MRIAVDARGAVLHRGTGLGTYSYQLIRHLIKAGVDLRLFWPGQEYAGLDIQNEREFTLIEYYRDQYWQEVFIPEALLKENIALYHVPQNGIGLPRAKICKYIVTVHDLIPYIYPETTGRGYLKKFLNEMPHIVEDADHIITVSEWSKKDLIRFFKIPQEKITVIYEAAEPHYRPFDKIEARKYLAEKYNVHKPYILYLGGFSPRKNVTGLINAFAKVASEDPAVMLLLPGKRDKEQENSELLVDALNLKERVKFIGFVPNKELPLLYAGAELFVYPSFYEGFGLPPLEAMACGTAVICSNASCLPEISGNDGCYFNPYDSLEMAEVIWKVLHDENLKKRLEETGLKKAKKFSWDKAARETIDVYQKLLAQ